ncbi:hypothetical protein CJF42_04330 [Pseudoalteromonas sp. NBT06-2]|uniref:tetratricopeptide repeat protein n=1 Tax=Pseudoalteromonas sp. NBT06-2 TaxID=2025950 RepID=UPI000BA79984|nr:tetratricopeptide repeat protein [Pseudoalteromonas sp. NBT06-2]PAJ75553.1 hypothetical protein CJF42_04330 [Pseudoalteromonas sp. NBT06-2]
MQTLQIHYADGNYQFAKLIREKSQLPDSAYEDIGSLRYLSAQNDLKAMGLLANKYEKRQRYLLAEKLYFKILNQAQTIADIKLARQSILVLYEKQHKWSKIKGFLDPQDSPEWHYLSQLHNSLPLSVVPLGEHYEDINHNILKMGIDFDINEKQLNITACKINIVPIASSYTGLMQAISVVKDFNTHVYLSSLPVCFSKPLYIEKSKLKCFTAINKTISCDLTHLATSKDWPKGIRHLMIIADKGKANVNQGVMYLAQNSDFTVFQHEFMHFFGFEDEYKLSQFKQKKRCKLTALNLQRSQLTLMQKGEVNLQGFNSVPSCSGTNVNAYKTVSELTLMQYLDKTFPVSYQKKLNLNIKHHLGDFPVFTMAFSKYAQTHYWYQYAANLGFKGALLQLALIYEAKGEIPLAINHLKKANDWPLAQSHLARIFYEKSEFKKARAYYLDASNSASDSFAQYFYGKMLLNGIGGKADKKVAMRYLKLSAAQNNPLAVQYLNNKELL